MNTVVDWRGGLIARLQTWGVDRRVSADWPGIVDAWRAASPPQWAQVNAGQRPWANFDELLYESLEDLAPRFGLERLDASALVELASFWRALPPWPDAVAGLQRLRRQHVIAPLSNGNVAYLIHMAKAAGLPWDAVFGADLFRRYKPAPETYLGASAHLGHAPEHVMLVASHPYDLDAAAKHGLRSLGRLNMARDAWWSRLRSPAASITWSQTSASWRR